MSIKDRFANSKSVLIVRVLIEKFSEAIYLWSHLSSGTSEWRKIEPVIHIGIHALEKGMSIGNVKVGFGKEKFYSLLNELQHYINIGGSRQFVEEASSVLSQYITFNRNLGADMNDIEIRFNNFIEKNGLSISDFGGIIKLRKEDIQIASQADFAKLSQSRFSVRDFGNKPISIENIKNALKMCEKTPSACNRQSWRIHIYSNAEYRTKLFTLQGGNKGFMEDMQYAILICGDMNRYRFYELSQVYVDGGLYAMNLMYALNYNGIASIPLTMSKRMRHTIRIQKAMNIPSNELPILLIGVGSYKDEFKVAKSNRVPFDNYCIFDK